VADAWPRLGAAFRQAILALVQASGESSLGQRVGSPRTQDLEAVLGPAAEGQGGAQASERRAAPSGGGLVIPEPARSAGVRGLGARPQSAEAEPNPLPPRPDGSARSGDDEQYLEAPPSGQHREAGLAGGANRFAEARRGVPADRQAFPAFPHASATCGSIPAESPKPKH
jgi:hypothetical protein